MTLIRLQKIDFATAARFFATYEHLGNCGLGVWHWGAFAPQLASKKDDELIGAVSFGTTCFSRNRGLLSSVAVKFGLNIYQICRGGTASSAPFNTPSRVVSMALAELEKLRGPCLVVAYADRTYNEVGTIYQACNALYTGLTNPKDQANYIINGKLTSGWLVRKRYGTRSMKALRLIEPNIVKLPLNNKYRYVFVQAPPRERARILRELRPLLLPYPTRDSERIPPMNASQLVKTREDNAVRSA
jgi:hypothetical protein